MKLRSNSVLIKSLLFTTMCCGEIRFKRNIIEMQDEDEDEEEEEDEVRNRQTLCDYE